MPIVPLDSLSFTLA